jgi:hypothetical protein
MYVQWQGMSNVETRQVDKATRNTDEHVAKCQECLATFQTVQEMQWVVFLKAMHEIKQSICEIP